MRWKAGSARKFPSSWNENGKWPENPLILKRIPQWKMQSFDKKHKRLEILQESLLFFFELIKKDTFYRNYY